MMVLLPDPVTTHLALYFDRTVEAVEAALQQQEYFLDRYWLPWPLPDNAIPPGDTSQDLRTNAILNAYRSAQPGVMIFTAASGQKPCVTYVFLVSESPTSGINGAQFTNAVKYSKALGGWSRQARSAVHIVGPFFSGSVPSAIALTANWPPAGPQIDFVSGTMSSYKQATALRAALNDKIQFRQTLHDDARARAFLLGFLEERNLTGSGRNVAILEEDETRYGSSLAGSLPGSPDTAGDRQKDAPEDGFPKVRYIKFPRELSRLRNASADSFGATPTAPNQPPALPSDGISWNWKDASRGEDSVPSFSGQQEPLSQQAVLLSISDIIRQENIKYVGIAATDIFDILFLSKFLKIAAPNTRLFVLDADVLMVRTSSAGRELDGTLAVTTYPLFARNSDWTVQGTGRPDGTVKRGYQPSVDIFPSRVAEGIYNAVQLALGPGETARVREYADPLSLAPSNNRPALWLTMVGRNGFWPVSHKENDSPADQEAPSAGPEPELGPRLSERLTFDPPDGTTLLLEGILLTWGLVHSIGVCLATKSNYPPLRQFEIREAAAEATHAQRQLYYLLCATLALSAMLLLIAISWGALELTGKVAFSRPSWFAPLFPIFYWLIAGTGAALLIAAGVMTARLGLTGISLITWFKYLATLGVWGWLNLDPSCNHDQVFFAQRSFYLSNGVSPLPPIELLWLMYYAWASAYIRKVRLSEAKQVRVPRMRLLGPGGAGLKKSFDELQEATDGLSFSPRMARWIVPGFLAAVLLLLRPWEALRSVEGSLYDALICFLVTFICLLIVVAWGRYLWMWSRLRQLLRGLERTPLRRAFTRFPKTYSWSKLWYEGANRSTYTISARSLECYQALVNCKGLTMPDPAVLRAAEMTRKFKRVIATRSRRANAVGELQRLFVEGAEEILEKDLKTLWRADIVSDSLDVAAEKRRMAVSKDAGAKCRLLAEEFVALRFVALIHYQSTQMKNLVALLAVGFILALTAVGSYPFLAGRECVWSLAAVFVIFGAAIVTTFAQMDRDPILSRLSGTDAGKLDWSFYLRVVSYGGLPMLALLASQFPSFGRSLFSWLEPALNALH